MNVKETTKTILSLPRKYKEIFTISIYDLLKQTGYFEIHDKVLVKDIQNLLTQHPEYIEDWIQSRPRVNLAPCELGRGEPL